MAISDFIKRITNTDTDTNTAPEPVSTGISGAVLGNVAGEVDKLNQSKRAIALLVVDTSGSVDDYKSSIVKSVSDIFDSLMMDPVAQNAAEVGVMTFNRTAEVVLPIKEIYNHTDTTIDINCTGITNTGEALVKSIEVIENRLQELSREGIHCSTPSVFFISDGSPYYGKKATEEFKAEFTQKLEEGLDKYHEYVNSGRLNVICLGVGEDANEDILRSISGKKENTVFLKNGCDFGTFAKMIVSSVSSASQGGKLLSTQELIDRLSPSERRKIRNSKED